MLEILDAIYDDISFHGGPAENAAFIEQMKDTVEKIKSGEIKTVPIDEVFKDLEEDSSESA